MTAFQKELAARLEETRAAGLYRELKQVESPQSTRIVVNGRELLNFSSNDYLGLASAPELKEAAIEAVRQFGAGAGGSRLICGSMAPHHALEEAIADFKKTEAALSFNTGYAAGMGAVCALVGKDDIVVIDKLVHACLVDAARLSGATLRVYRHNDLNDLERILRWARKTRAASSTKSLQSRLLITTESVFSMDGDHAPLRSLVELKDRYGAWLLVDEAHATGLYGPNRRGLAEEEGVSDCIEVQMGTLGKAVGASGGYICGARKLIDLLINRARTFIFSTAPVPAAAAAARAGIQMIQSASGQRRCKLLWDRVAQFQTGARSGKAQPSAIIPVLLGEEALAMQTASHLMEHGMFVPAVRFPTVPRGKARLRVTLSAGHTKADIDQLLGKLAGLPTTITPLETTKVADRSSVADS